MVGGEGYYLNTKWNGDDASLIGTQNPDQPERGAQEPCLRRSAVTVWRDTLR